MNGWIQANQRYVDLLGKKDCCWWYNERTNVCVLAGAVWRRTHGIPDPQQARSGVGLELSRH
ncbi:hypothetical protein DWF43_21270 [Salmonella enterica]|nr:hypothetical protein [Salmonella enterica]EBN6094405.1 hypothetical protein [Salmonella enterica]ECS8495101.1 hypothetical protein [Salmonella enterica subsp. enterica serovar Give]PVM60207.1 hypothetical protein C4783_02395 [Salmonella enterica subsp. enterica serovar Gaminara]